MTTSLKPAFSRALAAALLVLALVAAYHAVAGPYLETYSAYQARFVDLESQVSRYEALIRQQGELSAQLERLQSTPEYKGYFLQEHTPALAFAALQNRVKSAIAASGGRLVSTQTVAEKTAYENIAPVTVKVHMQGTIETVYKLFHVLEGGRPFLIIDDLAMRSSGVGHITGSRTLAPQLKIQFNLTGYIRLEKSEGA